MRRPRSHFSKTVAPLLLLAVGCTGRVLGTSADDGSQRPSGSGATGGSVRPGDGPGSGGPGSGSVGPAGPGSTVPTAAVLGPPLLRRLTADEYRSTVQDLLGLPSPPDDPLLPDTRSNGYGNFASVLTVSATLAGQVVALADRVANSVDLAGVTGCSGDDSACVTKFIKGFGRRAFRQPLSDAEVTAYTSVYQAGKDEDGPAGGFRAVLSAFLTAPKLLYRFELGATLADGNRRALSQYDVATELSYLFTGSLPDAELQQAADSGALATTAQVEEQARRLLKTPRARIMLRRFVTQWFGLGNIEVLRKDTTIFPMWNDSLRASLIAEAEHFIDDILWDRDGRVDSLLTAPVGYVDSALASLYDLPAPKSAGFTRVELDPARRSGLATLPAVLATHAKPTESFPIARGKFIRKLVLCQTLAPPPAGENIVVPPPDPAKTGRERFAAHSANPRCAACHKLIDPIGFGYENYDGLGRYRKDDSGKPIDASGQLDGTDVDGAFTGAVQLAQRLAKSELVGTCAARQAVRWAFGRMDLDEEQPALDSLARKLGGHGLDIRELAISLATSDSFFARSPKP